ncbi:glutathione S-transferase family protein [Microvirga lenta]|uniref:glutathione S-transferase family protein n=1 Tax=Microvirga lenta TaxID=2881337 RepID=UPI001CFFE257|nr:glutathione S-transferase family protein [Microvirga lenta]MCB5177438.1 glutathione S-transferase family protein [Microvirga lenta]
MSETATVEAMKLWGRSTSVNVQKVLWVMAELGLEVERIDAGGSHGGLDSASYSAMNPNRRIPTLQDGDLVLWESNVIVRYFSAVYGRGMLHPASAADAAVADQWMDWMQTTLSPVFIPLFWEAVRKPPSQRSPERLSKLAEEAGQIYAILDARLAETPWLGGQTFSMGDIPAGATLYRWFTMDIPRPDLPRLAEWFARLSERPAYRSTVMTSYDPLRGRD